MFIHNVEVAAVFNQIADLLVIKGNNPFRIRAYRNAVKMLNSMVARVQMLVKSILSDFRNNTRGGLFLDGNFFEKSLLNRSKELFSSIYSSICCDNVMLFLALMLRGIPPANFGKNHSSLGNLTAIKVSFVTSR